jgi:hypothetical protein
MQFSTEQHCPSNTMQEFQLLQVLRTPMSWRFYSGHADGCEVASPCDLVCFLLFPAWAEHLSSCLYVFFGEAAIQVFARF